MSDKKRLNSIRNKATAISDQSWQEAVDWMVELFKNGEDGAMILALRDAATKMANESDDPLTQKIGGFAILGIGEACYRAGEKFKELAEQDESQDSQ
jgi:hypothetical protein